MIKAAIFDLDGLLVDTEVVSYRILREILAQFGHPFALEEYTREFCGKPERDNAAHLVEAYRLPWTAAEALERIFQREEVLHAQGVALKPGALALLGYLAGVRVGGGAPGVLRGAGAPRGGRPGRPRRQDPGPVRPRPETAAPAGPGPGGGGAALPGGGGGLSLRSERLISWFTRS